MNIVQAVKKSVSTSLLLASSLVAGSAVVENNLHAQEGHTKLGVNKPHDSPFADLKFPSRTDIRQASLLHKLI